MFQLNHHPSLHKYPRPHPLLKFTFNIFKHPSLAMSTSEEVIVLDFWASPFAMRAKIALGEKGVEFEARHEDLFGTKSELLLESNPIYKKVPVLVHNGKAVVESLVILEYINEAWPTPALLPGTAHERAVMRFWADFVDKKLFEAGNKIWKTKGEEQVTATKEFFDVLQLLEGALGEKEFFGGETFGFLDIAIIPYTTWFYAYEKHGGFKVEEGAPKFNAWIRRCEARESVAKLIPDPAKVYEVVLTLKKKYGIE